jgi:DNA-binding beta-propeller fold protein YncE
MISYTLAAAAPLDAHVWHLAAAPGDGVCAALDDLEYLAIVSGITQTIRKRGNLYANDAAGVGVARTGEIYVSLPSMNCVAVLPAIDDGSRQDIRCTFRPGLICVSPADTAMYVATDSDATGQGIAVLDTVGKSIAGLVPVDDFTSIQRLVADPNGGRLFVATITAVYVVDLATRGIRAFTQIGASDMAVSPDGSLLYLLAGGEGISVVSTSTLEMLSTISVTGLSDVSSVAVSADGAHLFVAGSAPSPTGASLPELVLLVTEAVSGRTVTSVKLGAVVSYGPIVVSPDGSLIFVPTDDPTTIAVVQRKVDIRFLDVKVTIGSAPTWLVSRYAVQATYTTATGRHSCGSAVLDAGGGTVSGQVSDDGGHFPDTVDIAVTIDFVPGTGLTGVVRNFSAAVTDVGVNFLFEPDQMMQTVELIFDLTSPPPQPGDFLSIQWQHHAGGGTAGTGTKFLSSQDLAAGPVIETDITLMPDSTAPGSLAVTIQGRYRGAALTTFSGSFDVANTAVVLRPQPATGTSYTLAVAT